MKIMLYIRPKAMDFFCAVAKRVFGDPEIVTYSDYNRLGDVWAGKYIYDRRYDAPNQDFEGEKDDILPRCRTLRKMEPELACRLARRYWNGMEELFAEQRFDYVLMLPVDCYTLDIMDRVARKYGVHVIAFVGSPFAGYAKITRRGEYNSVGRNVPEDEIRTYVDKMTEVSYLSPSETKNVTQNHKSIFRYYFRRFLIEYFYYPLLKVRDHDPWNYHYNIYEVKGIPLKCFYDRKFESRFQRLENLHFDPATTVYYPMHLIPEATTDYWCPNIKIANYEKFVLDMIHDADPGITFIIKEHPAMYGRRRLAFYDALNELPNVILLHPMVRSNELLLKVENVVVDNGTVGIEALMRAKRVLVLSDNYYYKFHPNGFYIDRVTMESLHIPLQPFDNNEFMGKLLAGCFISDFVNSTNGIFHSDPDQVADGIKMYLKYQNLPLT